MARMDKSLNILCFLGLILAVTAQTFTDLEIIVDNCEVDEITEGQSKTLEEWCMQGTMASTQPLSVRVPSITAGDFYNFELVMVYNGETSTVPREITMIVGDDVTEQVRDMVFTAPQPETDSTERVVCNNYDALLSMRITSNTDPMKTFETEPHRVTVLCDFTGVDLMASTSAPVETLPSNTLPVAFDQLISDPSITFDVTSVSGSSSLPLLGNDAAYYVVAFLTKRPVTPPDVCDENKGVPEITFADTVLWYKRFKSIEDLAQIDTELKAVMIPNICGPHNLVVLVDPLLTIVDEKRCNNYVTIQIDPVGCTAEEQHSCHVILNPFENGRETAFIFQQHQSISGTEMPDDRFYKQSGFSTWKQEIDNDYDLMKKKIYEVQRDGYGRLKFLEKFIRDQIEKGQLNCDGTDLEWREIVSQLEQLEPDDITIPGINLLNMIPEYQKAIGRIQQLVDGTTTAEEIQMDAETWIANLPGPADDTIQELMIHKISQESHNAMLNITRAFIGDYLEALRTEARKNLCHAGDFMMYMSKLTKMRHDLTGMMTSSSDPVSQYYDMELKNQIGNITRIMVMMKYFYPDARFALCMDKMFERVVKYSVGELTDDHWLYDKCHTKTNNCLMKVKALCDNFDDSCASEVSLNQDEDLCIMRHYKEMIERENKPFGIHDIRRKLREANQGVNDGTCNGEDPVTPKNGPLKLYKMQADGTVMKGEPHLTRDTICWNPVAVCTCNNCTMTQTTTETPAGSNKKRKK